MMRSVAKKIISSILITLIVISPLRIGFFYSSVLAEEIVLEDLTIIENTTWNSNTDLSLYNNIYVEYGATLTIEKGSQLAFRHLYIYGNVIAQGTMEEKIRLTGIPPEIPEEGEFDPVCFVEPSGIIELNGPADIDEDPESVFEFVEFYQMGGYYEYDGVRHCPGLAKNRIKNMLFSTAYAASAKTLPAIEMHSGKVTMKNCIFDNNAYVDIKTDVEYEENWNQQSYLHIENSNFQNNTQNTALVSRVIKTDKYEEIRGECFDRCMDLHGYDYANYWDLCSSSCTNEAENDPSVHDKNKVVLKNNWYGAETGPSYFPADAPGTTGEMITGDFSLIDYWRESSDMASSVIFLPGIKASRLYTGNDKLWLPSSDADLDDLKLDGDGKSRKNIFTKDVIDEAVIPIFGANIYKSFINDLEDLKQRHIINDFSKYAYDWRFDVEDIAQNGTKYENEIKNALTEIENLQKTSTSQKVTIIAHSNGGLLAKAIMQELERKNETNFIDNIVMVSSPQMGTPEAIAAMLHGYDQNLPIPMTMDDADARELTENMPGAYGLLPSEEYFQRTQEPIIDFKTNIEPYKKYQESYGDKIDDYAEFQKFLLAKDDHREKPAKEDLIKASVPNEKLFSQAKETHDHIDDWTPPAGTKLIQIAGWGLDTISGMEYSQKPHVECVKVFGLFFPQCAETSLFDPIMEPKWTVDGDGTVTAPSSLMVEDSEGVERLWLDLYGYNTKRGTIDREHRNILEADQLRNLLSTLIKTHQSPQALPQYISAEKPADYENMKSRIRMALYSPLDIHLYDENNNHTGPITSGTETAIEENIPNTYYKVFGEQKYVGWSKEQDIRIELAGYGEGSYTVKLQEVSLTEEGEEPGDFTELKNLPTSDKTKVTFQVPQAGLKEMTTLAADYDGNGEIDYTIEPKINSSATLEQNNNNEESDDTQEDINDNNENQNNSEEEKREKPKLDSWKAFQYTKNTDKFCQQRLKLQIKGKRFDDNTEVFIGNQKAKIIEKKSSKKLEAIFCLDRIIKKKTNLKRSVSIENPKTKRVYANKKIDLNSFVIIKK